MLRSFETPFTDTTRFSIEQMDVDNEGSMEEEELVSGNPFSSNDRESNDEGDLNQFDDEQDDLDEGLESESSEGQFWDGEDSWEVGVAQRGLIQEEIGGEIIANFPNGVHFAIYDPGHPEFKRRSGQWAERENAVGFDRRSLQEAGLELGKSVRDSLGLVRTIKLVSEKLETEVNRARHPDATLPFPGTGPDKIRTLAIFSHGWDTTLAIGNGLTASNVDEIFRKLAPALADDVTVVLYGCSISANPGESGWVTGTMDPGGERSLSARIRDALIDQGKSTAKVWGHTEVGHTTRNPALRVFYADSDNPLGGGRGSKGRAFAGEIVFSSRERIGAVRDLEAAVERRGYKVKESARDAFQNFVDNLLRKHFYRAYVRTVVKRVKRRDGSRRRKTNLTLRGGSLPEMTPLYPQEVAQIQRDYWHQTYWTQKRQNRIARSTIRKLRRLKIVRRTDNEDEHYALDYELDPIMKEFQDNEMGREGDGLSIEEETECSDFEDEDLEGVGFDAEDFEDDDLEGIGFDAENLEDDDLEGIGFDAEDFEDDDLEEMGFDVDDIEDEDLEEMGFDAEDIEDEDLEDMEFDAEDIEDEDLEEMGFDAEDFEDDDLEGIGFDAEDFEDEELGELGSAVENLQDMAFEEEGRKRQYRVKNILKNFRMQVNQVYQGLSQFGPEHVRKTENSYTDALFNQFHPERGPEFAKLKKGQRGYRRLRREWLDLRDLVVRPIIALARSSKEKSFEKLPLSHIEPGGNPTAAELCRVCKLYASEMRWRCQFVSKLTAGQCCVKSIIEEKRCLHKILRRKRLNLRKLLS